MIYIKDIMMNNYLPTPEFQNHIIIIYPTELHNEPILKENMKHLIPLFKRYLEEEDLLNGNKAVLFACKFDFEKCKRKLIVGENEKRLNDICNEMNNGISPYHWKVYKNVDSYDYESKMNIKADYVLALET